MNDCIFCKIARGEIPCHKVYEDEYALAFLDINPTSKGHTLIVPKRHSENFLDIPLQDAQHIISVTQKLAHHYKSLLGATGFNTVNACGKDAQQSVFHYHMHLVPRYPDDGIDLWFHGHASTELATLASTLKLQ